MSPLVALDPIPGGDLRPIQTGGEPSAEEGPAGRRFLPDKEDLLGRSRRVTGRLCEETRGWLAAHRWEAHDGNVGLDWTYADSVWTKRLPGLVRAEPPGPGSF